MKVLIGVFSIALLVAGIWIGWKYQPWMPAGRAIFVSSAHLSEYDFQVWQRKNPGTTEPFTTWLFARKQGGKWMPFMLDFEDTYRPPIAFQKEDSGIAVVRDSTKLGVFDEEKRTFIRAPDGAIFPGSEIDSEPPGKW
jgi:hypothetical protein